MSLTSHELNQIKMIDTQVKLLQDKCANDDTILNTLIDFVSDTKSIVESSESEELSTQLRENNGFAHFLSLVSLALTA